MVSCEEVVGWRGALVKLQGGFPRLIHRGDGDAASGVDWRVDGWLMSCSYLGGGLGLVCSSKISWQNPQPGQGPTAFIPVAGPFYFPDRTGTAGEMGVGGWLRKRCILTGLWGGSWWPRRGCWAQTEMPSSFRVAPVGTTTWFQLNPKCHLHPPLTPLEKKTLHSFSMES